MRVVERLTNIGPCGCSALRLLSVLGTAALLSFLAAGPAGAAGAGEQLAAKEPAPACSAFCAPLPVGRLDKERAQGLDNTVGVILWDELQRRQSPPPPPTGNSSGSPDSIMASHGTVTGPNVIFVGSGPH